MPVVAVSAGLAALSMAGVPPFLGFVAKESVLVALVDVAEDGDGTGLAGVGGWLLVAGVTLGSVLTVAYAARFVWGAFATKPGVTATPVHRPDAGLVVPPAVLAASLARPRLRRHRRPPAPSSRTPSSSRPVPTSRCSSCGTASGRRWSSRP